MTQKELIEKLEEFLESIRVCKQGTILFGMPYARAAFATCGERLEEIIKEAKNGVEAG